MGNGDLCDVRLRPWRAESPRIDAAMPSRSFSSTWPLGYVSPAVRRKKPWQSVSSSGGDVGPFQLPVANWLDSPTGSSLAAARKHVEYARQAGRHSPRMPVTGSARAFSRTTSASSQV